MLMIVTFLILFARFPHKISCSSRTCIPNSHIYLNGKLCQCDNLGNWNNEDCKSVSHRKTCHPGHVVIKGCTKCTCQANGQYSCVKHECTTELPSIQQSLSKAIPWCNSFRTYYMNCNICVCPASGKPSDAHCAVDISCNLFREPSTAEISVRKTRCIPKVMYLFHCLHCLCPDDGYFKLEKCVERCERRQSISSRCIPNTIYRRGCNVCLCPNNSIPDDSHCTKTSCKNGTTFSVLRAFRNQVTQCKPHEFLKPKCVYCDCDHDGKIDKDTCLDLECLEHNIATRDTCNPGETVPFCKECLCTRSGTTADEYCTKKCSYDSKRELLETIIAMPNHDCIIDKTSIKVTPGNQFCQPNTVFVDESKMCICPDNGKTSVNLCIVFEGTSTISTLNKTDKVPVEIDFNKTCEPNTFVDFDCNSCFCSKKGKIDPQWCTYDDCDAIRTIQASHQMYPKIPTTTILNKTCTPGSISNIECNFCICPDSGVTVDRVCTKINCSVITGQSVNSKFTCEPLAYYEVDCNVCFCPKDGNKNVAKCTKNVCENTFLRTDLCVPGQLFSDECNVCICPPNGNKGNKACTNKTCSEVSAPWKKIFQLSHNLIENHIEEYELQRNLDLCFPGEAFMDGCKTCICPDVGLRVYATCSPDICEEDKKISFQQELEVSGTDREPKRKSNRKSGTIKYNKLNTTREPCMTSNFTAVFSKTKCIPGSTSITNCSECICPEIGKVDSFCRPLPENFPCEQTLHYSNATENARNVSEVNQTSLKVGNKTIVANSTLSRYSIPSIKILHDHTRYECDKVANITDECFKCECNGSTLIYQHCFRSNAKQCKGKIPSFLRVDSSNYDFT